MASINTLIQDIYGLFNKDVKFDVELFKQFGGNLEDLFGTRFNEERQGGYLRLSNIGKPDRQLWFEVNDPLGEKFPKEPLAPQAHIKFMYGDMQEQLCILLAKLAGHEVSNEQERVQVGDIPGHLDCIIDGFVVDVKSASRFAFPKFKDGTLLLPGNDPFGYIGQLAAYVHAKTPGKDGYFLAINKDLGHLALLRVPHETLAQYDVEKRIAYNREMVQGERPEPCYTPVEDGKSGNMKLATGCSYCDRKFTCWPNIRPFYYSDGPRYLTNVAKLPKVPEFPPVGYEAL